MLADLFIAGLLFEGVVGNLERRFRETDSAAVREDLMRWKTLIQEVGVKADN